MNGFVRGLSGPSVHGEPAEPQPDAVATTRSVLGSVERRLMRERRR
jgi:hypothetical protein